MDVLCAKERRGGLRRRIPGEGGPARESSRALRLLLVNQFGVNAGFYLLVPFLAGYLEGLGLAAAVVGVVLGARTLSQQGMFLLGGILADRCGCRPVIIAGCALRAVSFGLFAVLDSLPGLLAAAVLTGVAGALFNPAVRAYVAVEAGERKAEAFARFNVHANAGALLGPVLGAVLYGFGFRLVAAVAAVIFAVLTVAQLTALPARPVPPRTRPVWRDVRSIGRNRQLLAFTAAASGVFALHNQLYLALPLAAQRVTGNPGAAGGVLLLATVVALVCQVRVTAWCRARWSPGRCVAVGLAVMGAALLVPAPFAGGTGMVPVAALAVAVAGLSLGHMVANPFAMELIPALGDRDLPGTSFGVFYLASGVAAAVVSTGAGAVWDVAERTGASWLVWPPLAALGALSAAAAAWLSHSGRLAVPVPVAAATPT